MPNPSGRSYGAGAGAGAGVENRSGVRLDDRSRRGRCRRRQAARPRIRIGRAADPHARRDEAQDDDRLEQDARGNQDEAAGRRVRGGRGHEARCQAGGSCVGGHRSVLRGVRPKLGAAAARVASAYPRLAIGDSRVCTVLHAPRPMAGLACLNSQRKRAPSRHDRRSSDRAGGGALDPTHSDPRAARHGRLRRCSPGGRDLPAGVAAPRRELRYRRRPARVGGERRCLAGRAPDRVRSPARRPALEVDLRVVAGEPDLRLQLRAGLARVEHCQAARDPRDRRVRAPGDRVSDGQPAQPVRSRRRAVRLRAPRRTGAARASLLGGHGRLRSGLRPQRLRGLAERGRSTGSSRTGPWCSPS